MVRPIKGIVVDGGCSGNPGPGYYRGMDLETGSILFSEEIAHCTNNIAEYFAVAHCVFYMEQKGIQCIIYSDSQAAISWVNKNQPNSSLEGKIQKRLRDAKKYLANKRIDLRKWETKLWGENPADFGYKK